MEAGVEFTASQVVTVYLLGLGLAHGMLCYWGQDVPLHQADWKLCSVLASRGPCHGLLCSAKVVAGDAWCWYPVASVPLRLPCVAFWGSKFAGPKLTAAVWMVQEDASAKDSTLLDRTSVKLREAVCSKRGSHEQLALLFVALCRGLGLLTRSVR